jgi:transposase
MARRIVEPLRELSEAERQELGRVSSAPGESVRRQRRAGALLAVAAGASLTGAARKVGWQVGDSVAALIRRFNRHGLGALDDQPRSGRRCKYGPGEKERILREFRRVPDRDLDGTATWSVELLKRAIRQAADGLPEISGFTILHILHEAGFTWQESRTWCDTGVVLRQRKAGVVKVIDPEADKKRGSSSRHTG